MWSKCIVGCLARGLTYRRRAGGFEGWEMGTGQDGRWSMGIGGRSGFFLPVCNHVGQKGEAGRGQSALLPLQRWYIFFPPPSPDLPPSNKKNGRLQEYFQLLEEATSREEHQTQHTLNQIVFKSYGCPLERYVQLVTASLCSIISHQALLLCQNVASYWNFEFSK